MSRSETPDAIPGPFHRTASFNEEEERGPVVAAAVARAKAGDTEALRWLYLRYSGNVYGYVLSLVGEEHDAEDVTQQVFAKLMTVLPRYRPRPGVPFCAWIIRLARNAALDHMRQRRAIPVEEVRPVDAPDGCDDDHQRAMLLRQSLADVPEDQRHVLMLRHIAGYTPVEIARRLGKTEPAVHGLHHRGRSALRAALSARGCEPIVREAAAA